MSTARNHKKSSNIVFFSLLCLHFSSKKEKSYPPSPQLCLPLSPRLPTCLPEPLRVGPTLWLPRSSNPSLSPSLPLDTRVCPFFTSCPLVSRTSMLLFFLTPFISPTGSKNVWRFSCCLPPRSKQTNPTVSSFGWEHRGGLQEREEEEGNAKKSALVVALLPIAYRWLQHPPPPNFLPPPYSFNARVIIVFSSRRNNPSK